MKRYAVWILCAALWLGLAAQQRSEGAPASGFSFRWEAENMTAVNAESETARVRGASGGRYILLDPTAPPKRKSPPQLSVQFNAPQGQYRLRVRVHDADSQPNAFSATCDGHTSVFSLSGTGQWTWVEGVMPLRKRRQHELFIRPLKPVRIDAVELAPRVSEPPGPFDSVMPKAVATFHCIGLYWSPPEGATTDTCRVRYRAQGASEWRDALPLWFDAREPEQFAHSFVDLSGKTPGIGRSTPEFSRQYRGSIVNLEPDTTYEIELSLENSRRRAALTCRTWSQRFPIAKTVILPERSDETLVIDRSGSPNGYIAYVPPRGAETAVIDFADKAPDYPDHCVEIRASYVIVQRLTLRNAGIHGIRIFEGSHDVTIDGCDIGDWGRPDALEGAKWGNELDSAIFARDENREDPTIERVVVQRCRLHHPRYDTNSWTEFRQSAQKQPDDTTWHPTGPHAIALFDTAGNHVIRYNEAWSDPDRYFNDIVGGGTNFCAGGSPNRDSDIYGNRLACCWDNNVEAEGGNCNVRIWGNYLDRGLALVAEVPNHVGPLYIWRNVAGICRRDPNVGADDDPYGFFLKAGSGKGFGGGRTYVFHNTLLQPPAPAGSVHTLGAREGLSAMAGPMINHVSRNNILHVRGDDDLSLIERPGDEQPLFNDFDWDLFNGEIRTVGEEQEKHGIRGVPVYDPANPEGVYALAPTSPGYDAGVRIPNFNDDFVGEGPDMGAQEAGTPPLEFGIEAGKSGRRIQD
ncbi:hypothetical protein JW916_11285 [Candidatus Sumerlaeota bacterium]|nr:hypothetical protein [Candidatus Sumerlaeota bacterium]